MKNSEKLPHKYELYGLIAILTVFTVMLVPFSKNARSIEKNDVIENPPAVTSVPAVTQIPDAFTNTRAVTTHADNKYNLLKINAEVLRSDIKTTKCTVTGNTAVAVLEASNGSICIPNEQNEVPLYYVSSQITIPKSTERVFLSENITAILSDVGNPVDTGGAFYKNKKITHFIPSEKLGYIGDKAFYECTALKNVFLPMSLEHIGSRAFYGCLSLERIYIPGETSVGEGAFALCRSLKDVSFSENIKRVGTGAFEHTEFYDGLTEEFCIVSGVLLKYNGKGGDITIPEGVRVIADSTFAGRLSVTSVRFPKSVEYIGNYAFSGCKNLAEVYFENEETITGEYAFESCPAITEYISRFATDKRDMFLSMETVKEM